MCVILFCLFWLSFCIGQDKQTESHMKGEKKKTKQKTPQNDNNDIHDFVFNTVTTYCVKNETKNFRKMPISNCDRFERILTKTKTNKQTNNCGRSNVILHQSCSYLFLFLRFAHDHIYIYMYTLCHCQTNKQQPPKKTNELANYLNQKITKFKSTNCLIYCMVLGKTSQAD